jgi:formate dehydrogenase maturation protein FdhE
MSFLATARVNYAARRQRAELLSSRYPFAAEILGFYRHVASFQRDLYEQLPKRWAKSSGLTAGGELSAQLDASPLLVPFEDFLNLVESRGPAPLAAQARQLSKQGELQWTEVLAQFWQRRLMEPPGHSAEEADSAEQEKLREFLARAFLQPCAEWLVSAMLPPVTPMTVCRCPRCNSLPLLGVLRQEGDGGKRFLQCSFCSQEWEFRRIFCAHCGEEQEQKLAVYVAEQFPHVRVETCETCRYYLRTIDLTKDGHAVPLVDDLAAIPLRLWAEENGYKRIQENLFST